MRSQWTKILSFRGARTRGWCSLTGPRGSALAILRDAWQEFPKGLRLADDAIDIELWPEASAALDYANPYDEPVLHFSGMDTLDEEEFVRRLEARPTAPLNLKSFALGHKDYGMTDAEAGERVRYLVQKHAADRHYCFCDTGMDKAYGSAKTHEFWLHFAMAEVADTVAESLATAVQEPVLALPAPEYVCGTGVARMAHPKDLDNFADIEKALELLFDRLVLEPQELCRVYGAINYGEMINGHTKANQIIYLNFKEDPSRWPDIVAALGLFNNEAQDVINQLWIYYLRTSERKYFKFAEAKSEHTEDVDFIHAHPTDPGRIGLTIGL